VGYNFEWDGEKAEANLRKHGVSFAEAVTVFGDPFSMNMSDPDHSDGEDRFIVMGMSDRYRLWLYPTRTGHRERESLALDWQLEMNGNNMKKSKGKARPLGSDEDTMRPEYDFSQAVRGVTAARYAEGTNVVLLDPDVAAIFPDTRAVNEALRTIVRLTRTASRRRPRKRTAT
jgi:uncharacterized DUF497 family protein